MTDSELEDLMGGVPPRKVDTLTRVSGHMISNSTTTPAFCECGERQPRNWEGSPRDWREHHLSEAWPEVRQGADETIEAFMARLSDLYVAASMVEQQVAERLGMGRPIAPGQPIPVMTEEWVNASDLVEVLEHQMNGVRERLLRTKWRE